MIKLKEILKNENMSFKDAAELMNIEERDVFGLTVKKFPSKEEISLVSRSFKLHPDDFMNSLYYVGANRKNFKILEYKRRNYPNIQFMIQCKQCGVISERNFITLNAGTKCKDCGVYFY